MAISRDTIIHWVRLVCELVLAFCAGIGGASAAPFLFR